ncbi:MAG TPA: hypothetical protein VMW66_06165 [Elusimicrobiales bacterium]|nr:hypothetical protein [Elusimicrobiales bacterium]
MAKIENRHKQRLTPRDVLYCQQVSAGADERKIFEKVFKDIPSRTKQARNLRFHRHKARAEVKEKILQLQSENEKELKKSIKKTFDKINYQKIDAFNDLYNLHKKANDKGQLATAVKAIEAIIKLIGLAEETETELIFKILKGNEK